MKKNFVNETHIEGRVYQFNLSKKVSGENSKNPGTEYITGTVDIVTDDNLTNVISVHYTYVTALTSKETPDSRFDFLNNLIDRKIKTVMLDGADNAAMVRIDSAIALNEFFSDRRTGTMELVSNKRNEGGFIHLTNTLNVAEEERQKFKVDMLMTKFVRTEADEEKGTPAKGTVSGYIFDFRNSILPVSFSILNENAMNYFEDLGFSEKNPYFSQIWGKQVSETVVKKQVVHGMFADEVREVPSSYKDYVITNMAPNPYELGEGTLTGAELTKLLADRETYVATIKQRQEDYESSKNGNAAFATTPAATGGFNF